MDISFKPKIYVSSLPVSVRCLSQDFRLTKLEHIPCAYCGKEMMTIKGLKKAFDSDPTVDTQMIEHARELGDLLSPNKQMVLNFLTQTQNLNGASTDNQILRTARISSRQYIREDILNRYNEIVRIIEHSDAKRLKTFMKFNEEKYREFLIRKASYEELINFVRSEDCLHISPNTKNEELAEINDVICDIEKDKDQYPEYFVLKKSSYRLPQEFYIDLFEKTLASQDHIIPKAKGGSNTRNNFIAVCRECNEKKRDMILSLFMHLYPQVKPNIENHIRFLRTFIPKYIAERKLNKEYAGYPDDVIETLKQTTGNELDLTT